VIMEEKLSQHLKTVMDEYLKAKTEPFSNHPLGRIVRYDLKNALESLSFYNPDRYIVKGSVGQGNWAQIPWIAIMNKLVTTSTQRGYYVVYLFSEDMKSLYLTLAQGVTESTREEMEDIKNDIRSKLRVNPRIKKDNEISLGNSSKALEYELSTALYIEYKHNNFPSNEELIQDLENMIQCYEEYIDHKEFKKIKAEKKTHPLQTYLKDTDLISHIHTYILSNGFYYSKENVINLYLALKTKPFVILSGISGTGKTQIVRYYAESLGASKENGRFTLIPVRPDWSDGSDLLGYTDLKGDFQEGPLTRVLREASQPENSEKPFFIMLDEMNLARVEYYFSDLLSIMESREWKGDKIITDPTEVGKGANNRVIIPDNVYIIGTVNMDETTHPFSKKVLDRANAIEFNDVKLDHFAFFEEENELVEPVNVSNKSLRGEYIRLKDAYKEQKELIRRVTDKLIEVNSILSGMNAAFGYRVRDEICFYMIHNQKLGLLKEDAAFDLQIHQKVLPRLSGSDERTYQVLKGLYRFCTNRIIENDDELDNLDEDFNHAVYPKSARKLADMLRRQRDDGFTSFWF
ncbi:MAG: MrcB family domain-containing protein, partial [Tuberibacillus sp.]